MNVVDLVDTDVTEMTHALKNTMPTLMLKNGAKY